MSFLDVMQVSSIPAVGISFTFLHFISSGSDLISDNYLQHPYMRTAPRLSLEASIDNIVWCFLSLNLSTGFFVLIILDCYAPLCDTLPISIVYFCAVELLGSITFVPD